MPIERLICYIDGFNLYYGLREKGWKKYYWLNLKLLTENLLKPYQSLEMVKYFTARISEGDATTSQWLHEKMDEKRRRQAIYLEALGTLDGVNIFFGHYLSKTVTCNKCGGTWNTHEEKMTDVCIATELLMDAYKNHFDAALIISGDSDLVPPIRAVREVYPLKKIIIAFPPARNSLRLKETASAFFTIGEAKLRHSLFPDEVKKVDGYVLKRPDKWKANVSLKSS
ncbi:MAG: NYN domain-containing protein [Candidatus Atribacteria bacterium]|nr:NYN domain-containing protein [Candidatus Atribacteria bacterium]